jgi:diaminohydroxyphosphoribosylaminopyrimidine deaminase/5-amino-6-(5-phosphoribosylamino)uracil reductase
MVEARDDEFVRRALSLAERGRGRTSPNPVVGAVVVAADGTIVGQGAHMMLGGPHAEVVALDAAGPRASGATLYCTLEPCVHHGRTGPCVERIVAARVRRVVFAMRDPNPRVDGRGAEFLRAHAIEVVEGVRGEDAARQNAPFVRWVRDRRPFVTIKAAASADGFVARVGERVQITGTIANRHFHQQRAAIDAIAVGSGTMLVDDPALTPRGAFRQTPLTRVIFDWRLRMPPDARVFSTLAQGPIVAVVSAESAAQYPDRVALLQNRGASVAQYASRDVRPVLTTLADAGITWLLVEGGPALHKAFAAAGLVDAVQWVVSPQVLGEGVPLDVTPLGAMAGGTGPHVTALGSDMLVEFDVHGTH